MKFKEGSSKSTTQDLFKLLAEKLVSVFDPDRESTKIDGKNILIERMLDDFYGDSLSPFFGYLNPFGERVEETIWVRRLPGDNNKVLAIYQLDVRPYGFNSFEEPLLILIALDIVNSIKSGEITIEEVMKKLKEETIQQLREAEKQKEWSKYIAMTINAIKRYKFLKNFLTRIYPEMVKRNINFSVNDDMKERWISFYWTKTYPLTSKTINEIVNDLARVRRFIARKSFYKPLLKVLNGEELVHYIIYKDIDDYLWKLRDYDFEKLKYMDIYDLENRVIASKKKLMEELSKD